MTDLKELKKNLSRRGKRPVLNEKGEPVLTSLGNSTEYVYISVDQFVDELAKGGKVIDAVTTAITDAPPVSPPTAPAPAPVAPATPVPAEPTKPVETPKEPEVAPATPPAKPAAGTWSKETLEKLDRTALRKLAKFWPDVNGNLSQENLVKALTGKSMNPPE